MRVLITILSFLNFSLLSHSQALLPLDSLLYHFSGDSKELISNEHAKQVLSKGKSSLKLLAGYFSNATTTQVYSVCQNKFLTKGEIAMILADKIETMPYALLTGIQNCTRQFCDSSPNRIEYYFDAIEGMGHVRFQSNYTTWLESKTRKRAYGRIN